MDEQAALHAYASLHIAFVWIHPFADDNGRMARLLANMPLLKAGLPPIVIVREQREAYLRLLNRFNEDVGAATRHKPVMPGPEAVEGFRSFCGMCWQSSLAIVEQARKIQALRQ